MFCKVISGFGSAVRASVAPSRVQRSAAFVARAKPSLIDTINHGYYTS